MNSPTGTERTVYPNEGHGHVFPRPDGVRARCGGPSLCTACAHDLARKLTQYEKPTSPTPPAAAQGLSREAVTQCVRDWFLDDDYDQGNLVNAILALSSPGPAAVTEAAIAEIIVSERQNGSGSLDTARALLAEFRIEEK